MEASREEGRTKVGAVEGAPTVRGSVGLQGQPLHWAQLSGCLPSPTAACVFVCLHPTPSSLRDCRHGGWPPCPPGWPPHCLARGARAS